MESEILIQVNQSPRTSVCVVAVNQASLLIVETVNIYDRRPEVRVSTSRSSSSPVEHIRNFCPCPMPLETLQKCDGNLQGGRELSKPLTQSLVEVRWNC
jgi:hypothetical protein